MRRELAGLGEDGGVSDGEDGSVMALTELHVPTYGHGISNLASRLPFSCGNCDALLETLLRESAEQI